MDKRLQKQKERNKTFIFSWRGHLCRCPCLIKFANIAIFFLTESSVAAFTFMMTNPAYKGLLIFSIILFFLSVIVWYSVL